ncbi:MAG: hypothetical protein FVQ77_16320 [Cytophagales bacterium]|nr:hypothetical protein [Cytophagales bacterium]
MEDYTKYILYAVIAILYILFKVFRKKKPATTNDSPLPNSQPDEPSYSSRSTEDEEEPYASPTETDDEQSTFKGSVGELLKEFMGGPKHEEFDPESLDREDELREEIPDSEYQDEDSEPEEIEIIADPPQKTYERAGETSPPASRNAGPMSTGHRPPRKGDFTTPIAKGKSDGKVPPFGGDLGADAYSIEGEEESKYARILRDPQNAKEAFIMSEIFKKKYE